MSGSTVTNHISLKMVFEYSVTRKFRTSRGSWFINNFLKLVYFNTHDSFRSGNCDNSDHHPAIESSESLDGQARRYPYTSESPEELLYEPTEIPEPNKNEDHEQVRGSPYADIPEWLQEFRENFVDERVREHRDSHASSSREPEPPEIKKRTKNGDNEEVRGNPSHDLPEWME